MITMEKRLKEVSHPVHHLIQERWSPVVFSEKPVEPEKLRLLFEAARWAPSCYNEQPWSFVLGVEKQDHDRILSCLVDANQEWAQHAPVLGISVTHLSFAKNDKPNRHAYHDVGLAMGLLILEAAKLGLVVHQMAGFRAVQAREELDIPDGYDPIAAFAIGYHGDPKSALEKLRKRDESPTPRKGQEEFVFGGKWGLRAHFG